MEIKNRRNGKTIFKLKTAKTMKEAVRKAIEENINLRSANLSYANLSDANLSDANLRSANLRFANLSDANLRFANLSDANLRSANLSDANLSDANLSDANLRSANLSYANLSDANLSYANLSDANLSDASYCLPDILKLKLIKLPDELTRELMRWDATLLPDPSAMDRWAKGGTCPCPGQNGTRQMFFFSPDSNLWKRTRRKTPTMNLRQLWEALAKHAKVKIAE